jgi:hypothetical protein
MSWGTVGRWVLLAGSLVLGLFAGVAGFWIFESKVPAAMQTAVLATEARVYYLAAGLGLGFAIYFWTRIAASIARRAGVRSSKAVPVSKGAPTP